MKNTPGTTPVTALTIKEWVNMYTDRLYSWALYKTNNKETAEDLVQDTFLVACQSLHAFKYNSDPKTWLFAILNNKIADHHRRCYRTPSANEQLQGETAGHLLFETFFNEEGQWVKEQRPEHWESEPAHLLDDSAFTTVLQQCMQKLPAVWFSAVQLKYIEQRKGELICQELQIAPTNFWQILHRAKLQLRKCLELHWFKSGK